MNMLLIFFGCLLTFVYIITMYSTHKIKYLKQLIDKQNNVHNENNEIITLDALNQSFHKQYNNCH